MSTKTATTTTTAVKKIAVAASPTNGASALDGANKVTTQITARSKKASIVAVTVTTTAFSEVGARSSSAAAKTNPEQQRRVPGRIGIQTGGQTPRNDSTTDTSSSLWDVSSMELL